MTATKEKWESLAIEIGDSVYRTVNLPSYAGTERETGYVLMFFNVVCNDGKSTLVSSVTDPDELRQLLKGVLKRLDRVRVINRVGAN